MDPVTGLPYIVSTTGGRDTSPEGLQVSCFRSFGHSYGGLNHLVLKRATSAVTRTLLYLSSNPLRTEITILNTILHMAFGGYITGKVENSVMVMDFIPGVF